VNGSRDEAQKLRLSLRHLQINDIIRTRAGRKLYSLVSREEKKEKLREKLQDSGKKKGKKRCLQGYDNTPRSTRVS
jgi:hypothetical protein